MRRDPSDEEGTLVGLGGWFVTGSADLWFYVVQTVMGLILFGCGYVVARLSRRAPLVVTETTFVQTVDAADVRRSVWVLLRDHVDLEQSELSCSAARTVSELALRSYRQGRLDGLQLACVIVNPQAEAELAGVLDAVTRSTSNGEETKRDD